MLWLRLRALFFYVYTGIAIIVIGTLGGSPGHFTTIVSITIFEFLLLRLYIHNLGLCDSNSLSVYVLSY